MDHPQLGAASHSNNGTLACDASTGNAGLPINETGEAVVLMHGIALCKSASEPTFHFPGSTYTSDRSTSPPKRLVAFSSQVPGSYRRNKS